MLAITGALSWAADTYSLRPVIGSGSKGDGGKATSAILDGPFGLAEDSSGNLYISESNSGVIRRVRPDGIVERFAGTGALADGVQGQSATATDLISPTALTVDKNGNLLFADSKACRIRMVRTDGTIQDIAGTGRCAGAGSSSFPGGGNRGPSTGPALQIDVGVIGGLAVDSTGRVVYSEESTHVVRRLDSDGVVRTIAGVATSRYYGDSGPATSAALSSPRGLAYDGNGNLYIADGENCRIRVVDASETITTLLSTGSCTASPAARITGLAYDPASHSLVIALPSLRQIIRADIATGNKNIVLGDGKVGVSDTNVTEPRGVLVSKDRVLVADNSSFRVIAVQGGAASVFAGMWPQLDWYASGITAPLLRPMGLCVTPSGALIAVDAGAERVLSLSSSGQLTAVAGARYPTGFNGGVDGPATAAHLANPTRVACGPDGRIYIALSDRIRSIDTKGVLRAYIDYVRVTTSTTTNGTTTTTTTTAAPSSPMGMAIDSNGNLVFSESGMNRVLRWDPSNQSTTLIAGTGAAGFSGDGAAATTAKLNNPGDVAFDSAGALLIADRGNGRVRRVTSDGKIQTIAGSGLGFSYADISGQLATDVGFGSVGGMAVDAKDNIYIAEATRISVIATDGRVQVLAGLVGEDDRGNRSYRIQPLTAIDDLTVDARGRIYFSLNQNGQVMLLANVNDLGPAPSIGAAVRSTAFGGGHVVARGTWIEIYGSDLAAATRSWSGSDFLGTQAPTALNDTSVSIGGKAAFVSYISSNQVNALVPSSVPTGTQQLTLSTRAGVSASYSLPVETVEPGIFAVSRYAGGLLQGGAFAMPANTVPGLTTRPARAGENVTFFGTGFGPVTPEVDAGTIASGTTTLDAAVTVLFGQTPATVTYAGLSPGSVGLYQFNVTVPAGVNGDSIPLTFSLAGTPVAQTLYIAVQP